MLSVFQPFGVVIASGIAYGFIPFVSILWLTLLHRVHDQTCKIDLRSQWCFFSSLHRRDSRSCIETRMLMPNSQQYSCGDGADNKPLPACTSSTLAPGALCCTKASNVRTVLGFYLPYHLLDPEVHYGVEQAFIVPSCCQGINHDLQSVPDKQR